MSGDGIGEESEDSITFRLAEASQEVFSYYLKVEAEGGGAIWTDELMFNVTCDEHSSAIINHNLRESTQWVVVND